MNDQQQTTAHVLMIRPAHFGFNEQTADNNAFQQNVDRYSPAEIEEKAKAEFDDLVLRLQEKGIVVNVVQDSDRPEKPDAVFPNNWVTFHQDGTVITYPMFAPLRRQERRQAIIDHIGERYRISRQTGLEKYELQGLFLEGTGSMILDRIHRIVYACTSARTDIGLLEEFCQLMNYRSLQFRATDRDGMAIYHTNVMMALAETFVVICLESIPDQGERAQLLASFRESGKSVIEISFDQMLSFAGNMLQLRNREGDKYMIMSERAYRSLHPDQVSAIEKHSQIIYSPLRVIETYGGGSARCMIAEIFLEEKS